LLKPPKMWLTGHTRSVNCYTYCCHCDHNVRCLEKYYFAV